MAFFGFLLNDSAAAFRTGRFCFDHIRFCVFAVRITRTGKEFSEPSDFNDHHSTALIAWDVCLILLKMNLDALHLAFDFIEIQLKIIVKSVKQRNIIFFSFADKVKVTFHLRGELGVDDFREFFLPRLTIVEMIVA